MQIDSLQPAKRLVLLFHASFICIYLLLIVRAGIAFYEGDIRFLYVPHNSLPALLVKRISGVLYQPFYGAILFPPDGNSDLIAAIVFALSFYALVHYGMFMSFAVEGQASMANKILAFCRAIFFLAGTLLLLLIIARISVMLYRDIAHGRVMIGVPAKN